MQRVCAFVLCSLVLSGAVPLNEPAALARPHGIDVPLRHATQRVGDRKLMPMLSSQLRSVALRNFDSTQYIGEIQVGSPPRTFSVILDTGSANTWIYSTDCTSNSETSCSREACRRHKQYHASSSSSFTENNTRIEITYGSGKVKGQMFQDTMLIDNCPSAECKAAKGFYMIGASCVNAQFDIFDDSPFDGVMGLGFPELGVHGTKPILNHLVDQGSLSPAQMLFTFYLNSSPGQPGSKFSIGYIDQSLYTGQLHYHNVIPGARHWSLRLTEVRVGNTLINTNCGSVGCPIVPDTGTSLLTGPEGIVDEILKQTGDVREDCSNSRGMPPITFVIDSVPYELAGEDYVFRIEDRGKTNCYAGVYGMNMPSGMGPNSEKTFILGDSFLRRYFSVFDVANRRVGLAPAR